MNAFFAVVLSNVLVALLLAILVVGVARCWRSPQLTHALWALVLLKLVTPPVAFVTFPHEWLGAFGESESSRTELPGDPAEIVVAGPPRSSSNGHAPEVPHSSSDSIGSQAALAAEDVTPSNAFNIDAAPFEPTPSRRAAGLFVMHWQPVCGIIWCMGAAVYALVLLRRFVRFRIVLAASDDAPREVVESAARLAERLGLKHCPPLRVVDASIPPLVWSLGLNPIILLPSPLLDTLDHTERDAVIAHELAHVYRRDDLVRWLELLALIAFWWNPVAWFARCKLREAEEECCDAWVVWALPTKRRQYGQAMLKTIEYLTERPLLPVLAGSAFGTLFCKRRIEMIMKHNVARSASWQAKLAMLALAVAVLPLAATAMSQDEADALDRVAAGSDDAIQPDIPNRVETGNEDAVRSDEDAGNHRNSGATWMHRSRTDAPAHLWQQFYFRGEPADSLDAIRELGFPAGVQAANQQEWRVLPMRTSVSRTFVTDLVAKFPNIKVTREGDRLLVLATNDQFVQMEAFAKASGIQEQFMQFKQPPRPGSGITGSYSGSRFARQQADDAGSSSQDALRERIDVLQEIRRLQENAYKTGEASLDAVLKAKVDLTEAQLELAAADQRREKVWKDLVDYARGLEAMVQKRFQAGKATQVDVLKARAFRLKVEEESSIRGPAASSAEVGARAPSRARGGYSDDAGGGNQRSVRDQATPGGGNQGTLRPTQRPGSSSITTPGGGNQDGAGENRPEDVEQVIQNRISWQPLLVEKARREAVNKVQRGSRRFGNEKLEQDVIEAFEKASRQTSDQARRDAVMQAFKVFEQARNLAEKRAVEEARKRDLDALETARRHAIEKGSSSGQIPD